MALFASSSRSTTMFCKPAPSAISIATAYFLPTFIRLATGPRTPRSALRSDACMTVRTALLKPSYSFSISPSRRMRESKLFISIVRETCCSPVSFSRSTRPCIFIV